MNLEDELSIEIGWSVRDERWYCTCQDEPLDSMKDHIKEHKARLKECIVEQVRGLDVSWQRLCAISTTLSS